MVLPLAPDGVNNYPTGEGDLSCLKAYILGHHIASVIARSAGVPLQCHPIAERYAAQTLASTNIAAGQ